MKTALLVALGGAFGTVARYQLSTLVMQHTEGWRFPAGTFAVNVLGCLAAGLLAGLVEKHDMFTPETRTMLFSGVLGGFTTFSAFGLETMYLIKRGDVAMAVVNVVLSVLAGLAALWLGMSAIRGG